MTRVERLIENSILCLCVCVLCLGDSVSSEKKNQKDETLSRTVWVVVLTDQRDNSSMEERIPLEQNDHRSPQNSPIMKTDSNRRISSSFSHHHHHHSSDRPSNERLLGIAFVTFTSFALVELAFAICAGSDAMMGDAAAMMVDSFTYLFNWIAERQKQQLVENDDEDDESFSLPTTATDWIRRRRIRERHHRKQLLQLEIIPPIISVSTLIVVTVFVTNKSIRILYKDLHRSVDEQKKPNLEIMVILSLINLVLDLFNVFCFARAKHLLGFATTEQPPPGQGDKEIVKLQQQEQNHHAVAVVVNPGTVIITKNGYSKVDEESETEDDPEQVPEQIHEAANKTNDHANKSNNEASEIRRNDSNGTDDCKNLEYDDIDEDDDKHANLNMCSAYTHVFADTLRSIAVIVAVITAEVFPLVTPEEADAAAAVVVSAVIVLSLLPLFQGLLTSMSELRAIQAEERNEVLSMNTCASFEMT